ncbi:MAG: Nif3-like dinuclear metal center hexameric protein [Clostridia bacterium]|nr:Nif3-like dinuclear metal center hexameric protein [Clostridia bacterium]
MQITICEILNHIEQIAPAETAEAYDNVGLILGRRDQNVSKVLIALDATMEVVEEAEKLGAELILTHHPLLFHARKKLTEEDPEAKVICRMIRSGIALLSAHTNLDKTFHSGSVACADLLGLKDVHQEGLLFIGTLPAKMTAFDLKQKMANVIMPDVRLYGDENIAIETLAICGGAYDEGWLEAKASGAQALLTGEVRHHNALAAVMDGFALYDAGHFGTEAPLVKPLCEYLQNWANDVQYDVTFFSSDVIPYGRT